MFPNGIKKLVSRVDESFQRKKEPVLSDSATPSNLNASNVLTVKENIMFHPIFGMLCSRAIQNIPDMIGYL